VAKHNGRGSPDLPESGWSCRRCGPLNRENVRLYRTEMLNTHSRQLDPCCRECGAPASFRRDLAGSSVGRRADLGNVLVINGTCSSGKTTVSYLLSEHHQFIQVDGDWIWQRAKQDDPNTQPDDIHDKLALLAASLVHLGWGVALAHIILPDHLGVYDRIFRSSGVEYRNVILMPEYATLLSRNEARKCWPKTTPVYWVDKFYNEFLLSSDRCGRFFYDNTHETEAETAEKLSCLMSTPLQNTPSRYE
jgi:hypothetical protein